jgi:disulfide bond formation protein DsbB
MTHRRETLDPSWTLLFLCWLVAAAAVLGSLFFSEVMDFPPCTLCWYQRIFLFPLLVLFTVGLFPFDRAVVKFSLPLAVLGWLTALYHNLLYAGIIPERLQPCRQGVSCTQVQLELFGFLSIPLLSLAAFTLLVAGLVVLRHRSTA